MGTIASFAVLLIWSILLSFANPGLTRKITAIIIAVLAVILLLHAEQIV